MIINKIINKIILAVAARETACQEKHLYLPKGQNLVLHFFFCPGVALGQYQQTNKSLRMLLKFDTAGEVKH